MKLTNMSRPAVATLAAVCALSVSATASAANVPAQLSAWYDPGAVTQNVMFLSIYNFPEVLSFGQIGTPSGYYNSGWFRADDNWQQSAGLGPIAGSAWTTYFDGASHTFFIAGDYDLHTWSAPSTPYGFGSMYFNGTDITQATGAPRPMFINYATYTETGGALQSSRTVNGVTGATTLTGLSDNNLHVYYTATDYLIHESYFDTTQYKWFDHVIMTNDSVWPNSYGGRGLTSVLTNGQQHIFFTDFDNNLQELWFGGALTQQWHQQIVTSLAGLSGSNSPNGFLTAPPDGLDDVFGAWLAGPDVLQEVYSQNGWKNAARDVPAYGPSCPTTSLWEGEILHVFYVGTDRNVYEVYRPYGSTEWFVNNLSQITSAVAAAEGAGGLSPIASIWDGSVEHVYIIAPTGHVQEFYHNPSGWFTNDLMIAAQESCHGCQADNATF